MLKFENLCEDITLFHMWCGFVAENHDRICYGEIQHTVSGKGHSLTMREVTKICLYSPVYILI